MPRSTCRRCIRGCEWVRYEIAIEKRLLLLLESEDSGQGVRFSDHEFINSVSYSTEQKERCLANHDLTTSRRYHLERMMENALVGEREGTDASTVFFLTTAGHKRLDWHRQNTPFRKLVRWLNEKIDKALTSVILPIVVSVLTVIVLNYLGLAQNQLTPSQQDTPASEESTQ